MKAVHTHSHTKTNRSDSLLLPPCHKQKAEGGVDRGDMLQQMAHLHLLIFLFSSSRWSATCGGGHILSKSVRPPWKSRMQVIYHERSRSPQIKVCCVSAWFFLCARGFCSSLFPCQTEWVWKSQWHRWEFAFARKLSLRSILNSTDHTNLQFNFSFFLSGKLKGLVFSQKLSVEI